MIRIRRASSFFVASAALLPIALLVASSCSSGGDPIPPVAPPTDSGAVDTYQPPNDAPPPNDGGPAIHCKLDNGTDPVGLCVQKLILRTEHEAAFIPALGIAQSWDSKTFLPDKDATGTPLHDARDDAAYGASIARYLQSAKRYGDTEINTLLGADLVAITAKIEAELASLPKGYSGELYFDLRAIAAGLRYEGLVEATKIDDLADAYGRAIFDSYYHALTPILPPSGDAGDAGDASDGGDAASEVAADAATGADGSDGSGDDGAPIAEGILGVADGDAFLYEPADVATGALALIDLALRHDTEDAATKWQRAAVSSLDHLHRRARDPATGLYFRALLTTSSGPSDAPAAVPEPPSLPEDALLTDVQATIALTLSRGQELADQHAVALPMIAGYPFEARADAVIAACNGAPSLWDDLKGGYRDGLLPSTGAVLDTKSTRANARMLAAIHRISAMHGSPFAVQLKALRGVMLDRAPAATGLLSILADQSGYLQRAPSSFVLGPADAGTSEPRARSYFAAANAAAIDGLTEQWFGLPF